jgi:hypothetical protein
MATRNSMGAWTPDPGTIINKIGSGEAMYINSPWGANYGGKDARKGNVRISGIKIQLMQYPGYGIGSRGDAQPFTYRFDRLRIQSVAGACGNGISIGQTKAVGGTHSVGVIDHNNIGPYLGYAIHSGGTQAVTNKPLGQAAYSASLGYADAMVVENNYYDSGDPCGLHLIIASDAPMGHWVFRYNVVQPTASPYYWGGLDVHGVGWDSTGVFPNHACGPWEIYNNDFIGNSSEANWSFARPRGFHGVIFKNNIQNMRNAVLFTNDSAQCPPTCGTTQYVCGMDSPGRSWNYTPGVHIWGNSYSNMNPDSYWTVEEGKHPYYSADHAACVDTYVRPDIEIFGYRDGLTIGGVYNSGVDPTTVHPCDPAILGEGGDWSVCQDIYQPYTCPHPLVTELAGQPCNFNVVGASGYPNGSTPPSDTTPPAAPTGVAVY